SYDYGAALDEFRQQRPKLATMKELGLFLQAVPSISKVDVGAAIIPSSPAVKIDHTVNPDTQTHFYFAVHNPSNATTNDTVNFPIETPDGNFSLRPQLNGQDAKTLVTHRDLAGQHQVYSTSEIPPALHRVLHL